MLVLVTVTHAVPYFKYPEVKEAGKMLVQRHGAKLVKSGFQIREVLRLGKPADEILIVAKQEKADLIVTGAKGLGMQSAECCSAVCRPVWCSMLTVECSWSAEHQK